MNESAHPEVPWPSENLLFQGIKVTIKCKVLVKLQRPPGYQHCKPELSSANLMSIYIAYMAYKTVLVPRLCSYLVKNFDLLITLRGMLEVINYHTQGWKNPEDK